MLRENNRERRNHSFYEGLDRLPALYSTESVNVEDKTVLAHYFNTVMDWWLVEFDPITYKAFGFVRIAEAPMGGEWGDIDLIGLELALPHSPGMLIERDTTWQPRLFSTIQRANA